MPLPRVTPPRSRTNDLLDYPAVIADMASTPGDWCLVAEGVSNSDADKITRTLKQYPMQEGQALETATRGADGETRNVYAVYTGPASSGDDDGPDDDDEPDPGMTPPPGKVSK